MSKKGKVIGSIIGGLVTVGAVIGAVVAFSNMQGPGPNPNPPQTQLATVQNIEYNQEDNLLTWDDVTNANSYNVSIVSDGGERVETVKDNFYTVALTDQTTEFKVQAYDTTNTYLASEWSEPLVITLQQEDSLVADVNEFAESICLQENDLQRIISVHPDGNYLVTTGVYEFMGENYILSDYTDCGEEVQSLRSALKTKDAYYKTTTKDRNLAKNYDTASSFLARSEYSENLKNIIENNNGLKFVTSQAYDANGAVGLTGILKVNKNQENHYYVLDVIISVLNVSNEQYKFTNSVEEASVNNFYRCNVTELTGDFAEYAEELDNLQNTTTKDYGMSL